MNQTRLARQRANKLTIHRETLRRLDAQDLADVHGGLYLPPPPPTPSCPTRPTTKF
jgi:hypothetical protein